MIKIQQQAVKMTRHALDDLLRTIKFVPEDKREWSPEGGARTVNDQLAECIQFAEGLCDWLTADFMPTSFDREKYMARRQQLAEVCKNLDRANELARARYEELYRVIENTPDSRLEQEYKLPFIPTPSTGADMLWFAYWNLVYHFGQINYIQTMLGDREMH